MNALIGGAEGPCGPPARQETGTENDFCIYKAPLCPLGSAYEACSWNWYGEKGHNEDFSHAEWSDDPIAECGAVGEGAIPDSTQHTCGSDPPSPVTSAGSSASGGDPTTGDPTTGDPEDPIWLCSLRSDQKCADINPDNALNEELGDDPYPMNSLRDACWAPVETDPLPAKKISKCKKAANQADAIIKCEEDCNMFNAAVAAECVLDGCTVNTPVDCVLNGTIDGQMDSLELPALLSDHDDTWRCPDGFDSLPAWEGVSDFVLFTGSGSLVTTEGITVGASGLTGYLGYTLSGCTATSCTITIDALEGISRHVEGGYTDAAGGGGTYELAETGFRARSAISGTWNKTRFTVSFPSAVLELQFWADPVSVDGVPIASGVRTVEVDQLVGSLRTANGPLTLNLAYNLGFATLAASVTTQ